MSELQSPDARPALSSFLAHPFCATSPRSLPHEEGAERLNEGGCLLQALTHGVKPLECVRCGWEVHWPARKNSADPLEHRSRLLPATRSPSCRQ